MIDIHNLFIGLYLKISRDATMTGKYLSGFLWYEVVNKCIGNNLWLMESMLKSWYNSWHNFFLSQICTQKLRLALCLPFSLNSCYQECYDLYLGILIRGFMSGKCFIDVLLNFFMQHLKVTRKIAALRAAFSSSCGRLQPLAAWWGPLGPPIGPFGPT